MSAGQKNRDVVVVVVVAKFEIREVWLIQPYFRVGQWAINQMTDDG